MVEVVLLKDGLVNGAMVDVAGDELVVSEAIVDLFVEYLFVFRVMVDVVTAGVGLV